MEPGRAVLLLEESIDQRPGVLVVDDRDHELHGREYMPGPCCFDLDRVFD